MRLADLENARVAVWGYGLEGRAAVAALRKRFPLKEITLICSSNEAAEHMTRGTPSPPTKTGERDGVRGKSSTRQALSVGDASPPHPTLSPIERDGGEGSKAGALNVLPGTPDVARLKAFDIIIKSPGISPYKSPVPEAIAAGVTFVSGSALWFAEHAEARTICVTGTKGKSTVSALIAHVLRQSGKCTALAGNIGLPLLELLDPPVRPDWWVIELSSFQTRDFEGAPTVAVINNLYEEHLDWHGDAARYAADKLAIAERAHKLVVGAQSELLAATEALESRVVFGGKNGWHVRKNAIYRDRLRVLALAELPLPGLHNALNVCAALAAIEAAGEDALAAAVHVATFKPLPHRLQALGTRDGVRFVNDSISTTPYATVEALRSLEGHSVIVLVGGYDRKVTWGVFVDYVAKHPPHGIVTMGANGTAIGNAVRALKLPGVRLESAPRLVDAVARARTMAPPEGTILLSPGAPSFDQFRDYAERGREFARLGGFDATTIASIPGLGIA